MRINYLWIYYVEIISLHNILYYGHICKVFEGNWASFTETSRQDAHIADTASYLDIIEMFQKGYRIFAAGL